MDRLQFARLEGYLEALEALNSYTNHVATYQFVEVPSTGDVQASLEAYFEAYIAEDRARRGVETNWRLLLEGVDEWKAPLREVVGEWFLPLRYGPHHPWPHDDYDTRHIRRVLLDRFLRLLEGFFGQQDPVVWKLDLRAVEDFHFPAYHNVWDDYVFQVRGGLFLLHFGIDD